MDQLPLDGRLTDLRAFARLGDEGVDLLLADSTNAEVPGFTTPGARDRAGPRPGVRPGAAARSSSRRFASHVHRVQQVLDAAVRHTAARSPSSAGRWSATWASPAISATCACPAASWSTSKTLDDLPRRPGRAHLHRLAGRADVGAVPDGQPRPPHPDRRGRHRDPRVLADPGQRERRLPRHQRADPLGRQRSCTRATRMVHVSGHASAGELLYFYNIVRPRNVMPVHGEWRHLRANADLAVLDRGPAGAGRPRRGRRRRRPRRRPREHRRRGAVRLRLRRRLQRRRRHRRVAEGPPDPGRRGLHLGLRGGRLGHRQGRRRARRSTRAASPRTTPSSTTVRPPHRGGAGRRPPRRASATRTSSQQLVRRTVGRWVSDTYRRRPMIIPLVVEV